MLTDIMRKLVTQYMESLATESNIFLGYDLAEGFITRALQYHYQKHNANIAPINVKARMSEDELKQK